MSSGNWSSTPATTMMMLILLLACHDPNESLAPWPRDVEALEERCQNENNESLQTTCWVQLASRLGEEQKEAKGHAVCHKIQSPLWKEECYFRLGEELSVGGSLDAGFRACALAGRFTRSCLTHSMWRNPSSQSLNSKTPLSLLLRNFQENQTALLSALHQISPDHQKEAEMNFLARYGYSIYLGSGILEVTPSYYKDKLGVSFRTGYAFEWVRLHSSRTDLSLEELLHDWTAQRFIKGDVDLQAFKKGRTYQARISPFERDIPRIHLYGGGQRLVGTTTEDDVKIAGLEAFFWRTQTPASFFEPYILDPTKEIRLTATKLFLLSDGWTILSRSAKEDYLSRFDPAQKWLLENTKPLSPLLHR